MIVFFLKLSLLINMICPCPLHIIKFNPITRLLFYSFASNSQCLDYAIVRFWGLQLFIPCSSSLLLYVFEYFCAYYIVYSDRFFYLSLKYLFRYICLGCLYFFFSPLSVQYIFVFRLVTLLIFYHIWLLAKQS